MTKPAVFAAALACATVFACAGATGAPAQKDGGQKWRVTLYFLVDGGTAPIGIRTTVERRGATTVARVALQALLKGPKAIGARRGITTAIPRGTTIRSFSIAQGAKGSTATVVLDGLPRLDPPTQVTGVEIAQVGTQVARTLIGVSDIVRVRLRANGRPWFFWMMSGGIGDKPWDYDLLVGLWVGNFKAVP